MDVGKEQEMLIAFSSILKLDDLGSNLAIEDGLAYMCGCLRWLFHVVSRCFHLEST